MEEACVEEGKNLFGDDERSVEHATEAEYQGA